MTLFVSAGPRNGYNHLIWRATRHWARISRPLHSAVRFARSRDTARVHAASSRPTSESGFDAVPHGTGSARVEWWHLTRLSLNSVDDVLIWQIHPFLLTSNTRVNMRVVVLAFRLFRGFFTQAILEQIAYLWLTPVSHHHLPNSARQMCRHRQDPRQGQVRATGVNHCAN